MVCCGLRVPREKSPGLRLRRTAKPLLVLPMTLRTDPCTFHLMHITVFCRGRDLAMVLSHSRRPKLVKWTQQPRQTYDNSISGCPQQLRSLLQPDFCRGRLHAIRGVSALIGGGLSHISRYQNHGLTSSPSSPLFAMRGELHFAAIFKSFVHRSPMLMWLPSNGACQMWLRLLTSLS